MKKSLNIEKQLSFVTLTAVSILLSFQFVSKALAGQEFESEGRKFKIESVMNRSDIIWGFDFLDQDNLVFTEREGKLFRLHLNTKLISPIKGVPAVAAVGQGGLLDVRVDRNFKSNHWLYLTFSEANSKKEFTTVLVRAKLESDQLNSIQRIFVAQAYSQNGIHFGSRIEFDDQNHIFITVGERNERQKAQLLNNHHGKIIRLNLDGSVPSDNPFVGKKDVLPEIWSYGHRNHQGLAFERKTKILWQSEFGPRGGDEINIIKPGLNYGWPTVSFGKEYWGPEIGEGTSKEGLEPSQMHFIPSVSPSGISFYDDPLIPEWKGNLFVGCLSSNEMLRIVFDQNHKINRREVLLKDKDWRIRNIRVAPSGTLFISTDHGMLARISPMEKN